MSQDKQVETKVGLPPFLQFLVAELIKILPDLLNLIKTKDDLHAFLEHVKTFKK